MNNRTLKNIPVELIREWLADPDEDVRQAASNACQGRDDIPVELIREWLANSDLDVRRAASNACQGRHDVPIELIRKGIADSDEDVRQAASNACQGRDDIPVELIREWLADPDENVRRAACSFCKANGIPLPIIRTFEPPELVYKKCIGGVIVVAEIPKDAQVRGNPSGKCRSDKASIKQVIGDIHGEPVGISAYDYTTAYYAGDEVLITDFDFSNEECSSGFHFFCSIEQARNYIP